MPNNYKHHDSKDDEKCNKSFLHMINDIWLLKKKYIFFKINQLDFQNEIKCIMTIYIIQIGLMTLLC